MNVSLQAVLVTLYKKYPNLSIKIEASKSNPNIIFMSSPEGQEGSGSGFYDFDRMIFFGMEIQWLHLLEEAFQTKEEKAAELVSEKQFIQQISDNMSLFDERLYDLNKEDKETVQYKNDKHMYDALTTKSLL